MNDAAPDRSQVPAALQGTVAAGLLERIHAGQATCGVVGLGYVGLPLAVELARCYPKVLGVDVSAAVVDGINAGHSHVQDVPAATIARLVDQGLLEATTDSGRLNECDAIVICVPTPLSKTRDPDVSHVVAAAEAVAAVLRPGQLIILESTTYPGTTRELIVPGLERGGHVVGTDVFVCFSPERVDPGNERWLIRNTPKVIGGITEQCLAIGSAFYERVMDTVVPVSSTEAAELAKLLENTFRALNIALVNEMAQIADRLGVDVFEVIDAAATKPFGFMKFMPGPGIGGHCIPLDPHYLAWKMKTLNYRTRLIDLASEVNSEMPHFVVDKVRDALNTAGKALKDSRILVLGVAYKKDVDDVRESPALDIIRLLADKGARIRFHDPHVPAIAVAGTTVDSVPLTEELLADLDCVLVATDHSDIPYAKLAHLGCPIIDTRNALRDIAGSNIVGLSGARSTRRRGRVQ